MACAGAGATGAGAGATGAGAGALFTAVGLCTTTSGVLGRPAIKKVENEEICVNVNGARVM